MLSLILLLAAAQPPEAPSADDIFGTTEAPEEALPPFEEKTRDPVSREYPVAPYVESNANAGARPFDGDAMAAAFHGQPGIMRIVDGLVSRSIADPAIADIFVAQDLVRLRRTLFEQFCYILNAGCDYSGRDMKSAHASLGIRSQDLNRLVENLQAAMEEEGVPFRNQNRFLAKLAPMKKDVVER